MPRKYRTPKRRRAIKRKGHHDEMARHEYWSLLLGDAGEELPNREELWEIYGESLTDFMRRNNPGMRPRAYWDYEFDGERPRNRSDWEVLLEAGELSSGELEGVRDQWFQVELGIKSDINRSLYQEWIRRGRGKWAERKEEMDRQARLLDEVDAWKDVLQEMAEEWLENGCRFCAPGCENTQCMHREEGGGDFTESAEVQH